MIVQTYEGSDGGSNSNDVYDDDVYDDNDLSIYLSFYNIIFILVMLKDVRLNSRWLDIRVPANNAIMRIRSGISTLFREALVKRGRRCRGC